MSAPVIEVTPAQPPAAIASPTVQRLDRIAQAAGRFQSKSAVLLIAAGLLLILLGYAGASSATVETASGQKIVSGVAQFPYLLSGGVLGLALVVLGTGLLVAQRHAVDSALVSAHLRRLVELQELGGTAVAGGGASAAPDDLQGLVVAGTASYHVPSCRLVEGRPDSTYLLPVEATARGLVACRVCRPDQMAAPAR